MAEFSQIASQQSVCLTASEWKAEVFAGLDAVAIADVWIVSRGVPTLKVLDKSYGKFKLIHTAIAKTLGRSLGNANDE